MERRTITLVLLAIAALLMSTAPVMARAPEPVIAVRDVSEGTPPEPPLLEDDGTEPYEDDQTGRCPAGTDRLSPGGELQLSGAAGPVRAPGPVIAVRPPSGPTTVDPCLADIGLWLEVEAPNDKKPDGADGNLDDIAIPSGSLEGGFEVTLPAQDRVITLDDPGANWELTSTTCSCSGWTTLSAAGGSDMAALPGSATSYPGPVIAVRPLESGGPGSCTGVGAAAVASAPPALLRATGAPRSSPPILAR